MSEDYKIAMSYNIYLLEKYRLLDGKDYKKSDLYRMCETGRVSGEMVTSAEEYLMYLKLESIDLYCLLKESNPNEIKDWLWYEAFVRNEKIKDLLDA